MSFWSAQATPANHTMIDAPTLTRPTLTAMDPRALLASRVPKHVRCQATLLPEIHAQIRHDTGSIGPW